MGANHPCAHTTVGIVASRDARRRRSRRPAERAAARFAVRAGRRRSSPLSSITPSSPSATPHGNEQAHEFRLGAGSRSAIPGDRRRHRRGVGERPVSGRDGPLRRRRRRVRRRAAPGSGGTPRSPDRATTGRSRRRSSGRCAEVNAGASFLRTGSASCSATPPNRLGRGPRPRADHPRWLGASGYLPGVVDSPRGCSRREGAPFVPRTAPCTCKRRNQFFQLRARRRPRTCTRSSSSSSAGATRACSPSGRAAGVDLQGLQAERRVVEGPRPRAGARHRARGGGLHRVLPRRRRPARRSGTAASCRFPRDQWRSLSAEEQFDAVLYLGPPSSMTTSWPSAALCRDAAYNGHEAGAPVARGDAARAGAVASSTAPRARRRRPAGGSPDAPGGTGRSRAA